jgi:hypothetical protein
MDCEFFPMAQNFVLVVVPRPRNRFQGWKGLEVGALTPPAARRGDAESLAAQKSNHDALQKILN